MRKGYLLLCLVFITHFSFTQVSVTATTGTTGPTAYNTLQAAFNAINLGTHSGVVSITINANTTEMSTAVLNASGNGSASYTSVSVKPGINPVVISGNIAGPLIDLNGADNVMIDGLNTGSASLTIANPSVTTTACTIRFINDATANTIQNTTITGADTAVTTGTLFFSTGTNTGNDNNLVANCTVTDAGGSFPVNAIYSFGNITAGQENSGITVYNNNIANFFNATISSAGILVGAGNTNWTISTNRFFQTTPRTFTTGQPHRAIQITSGDNYSITGNIIGYASATGTGVYTLGGAATTRFLAIDLNVGTNTATNVQNNTVTAFSFVTSNTASSASGIWCAINIAAGNVNVGTTMGNTIGNISGTGAISILPTVGGTLTVGITSASTGTVVIGNNKIGAIDVSPSGVLSGNMLGIQAQGASGNISITNNTIGNTTANNMRVGAEGTTTGNGIIRGILNSNMGSVSITGNTIRNLTHYSNNALALFRAIECQQGVASITNNSISNITAYGAAVSAITPEGAGILVSTGGSGLEIDQNTISNLNVTNSTAANGPVVLGIYLSSATNGAVVTRNKIYGFTNAGTSVTTTLTSTTTSSIIGGIYCRDAAAANPNILIANNMISFGNAQNTNTSIIGIWNVATSANGLTTKIYYNSVNIEGTAATGAQPSFCYYRGDFSTAFTTPIVDLKNNIFTNNRSGGTGKHYAIANSYGAITSSASGWGTNAANYNVLNANTATIGYWSGDKTFAGWQAASAGDANSFSGINLIYANAASGDLHLTNTVDMVVDGKATPLTAITNDFDGQTRNVTTPDVGADEFDVGSLPVMIEYFTGKKQGTINVLNWKAGCSSTFVTFEIERSNDGRTFIPIEKIVASQARCAQPFTTNDKTPRAGINYYRLKMTEADGTITYSAIIAIINKESGFEILSLNPTLVQQANITLNVTSAQSTHLIITISDVSGKVNRRLEVEQGSGSGTIKVDISNLPGGIYLLTCVPAAGKMQTFHFIKQ